MEVRERVKRVEAVHVDDGRVDAQLGPGMGRGAPKAEGQSG